MYHWAREPRMTLTTLYCHYFSTGLSVLLNLKHVKEKIPFPKEISPGCSWAGTPILWPPDAKIWLIWKDPDAGKDWGQEDKGTMENEMVGWLHQLDGHEFGWTPGVGDGQGCLACCSSWGHKESDKTEWLNWTELLTVFSSKQRWMVQDLNMEEDRIGNEVTLGKLSIYYIATKCQSLRKLCV